MRIGIQSLLVTAGFLAPGMAVEAHDISAHREEQPGLRPTAYPDRIVVTWKGDPATSFSVTWRTDTQVSAGEAQIARAEAAPTFDDQAETKEARLHPLKPEEEPDEGHLSAHYHSVTFEGLIPDTQYAYRVGGEGRWSEWFHMRTASQSPRAFSFIYLGDAQNGIWSHWSRAVREAYSQAPADVRFILHAGDLVNRAHRNLEWAQWHHGAGWVNGRLPNIAVPGNHEYDDSLSIHWRPQFEFPETDIEGLNETVYSVDYQGLRMIALNSNRKIEEQADWLKETLADNPQRWTIVTHHHPVYSSGSGRDSPKLREHWKPLYEGYGVDLVLQGHDHTYARGGETVNLDQGLNARDPESGTVYVNSVSGQKMYDLKEGRWDDYGVKMTRGAENTQLYQLVRVAPGKLTFRAYTVTGELYDAFELVYQEETGKKRFVEQIPDRPERRHSNTP